VKGGAVVEKRGSGGKERGEAASFALSLLVDLRYL
jgi:hypothetical protein